MQALIAYIQFVGRGTPVGVRVPGMGLRPLRQPATEPNPSRGKAVYAQLCATCHGPEGQGHFRTLKPVDGYDIPPLWGADSFNSAAGMSDIRMAAAFIRANMPAPVDYLGPLLTEQQAWDVAAFITSQPRPAMRAQTSERAAQLRMVADPR
jgi:thiosulfate dehydrogenase